MPKRILLQLFNLVLSLLYVVEKCLPMFASEADKNVENIVPFTNSANSMEEKCKVTYQRRVSSAISCVSW